MPTIKEIGKRLKHRRVAKADFSVQGYVTAEERIAFMSMFDLRSILMKLGVEMVDTNDSKEWWAGFCPDHYLRVHRCPDKPKWGICRENGLCKCFTEGRTSNLFEVAKNIMGLETEREAFDILRSGREVHIMTRMEKKCSSSEADCSVEKERKDEKQQKLEASLKSFDPIFNRGELNEACINYFERDGIRVDTLRKFGVVSCSGGRNADRAAIPFIDENYDFCGYITIDYLGYDLWQERRLEELKNRYGKTDIKVEELRKYYRKTKYCRGFSSGEHLFGLYENFAYDGGKNMKDVMIVEGERDCLKMMQEGVDCVSIHGVVLKEWQRIKLKSLNKLIWLALDFDEAGLMGMKNISKQFINDADVRVIIFPNDPATGKKRDAKCFNGSQIAELKSAAITSEQFIENFDNFIREVKKV